MFITAYQRRNCTFTITVTEADGTVASFTAGDVMRVKIGRSGEVPVLDLDSAAPTANGSSVTAANPTTLTLAEDDAVFSAGAYDIEVGIVYDDDPDVFRHAIKGTFMLHETQLGDGGLS